MRNILRFREAYSWVQSKRMQIVVVVVCVLIGIFLVSQLRVQESISKNLQEESKQDLGEIIRDLDIEVRLLQKEERDLEIRLLKYENAAENQQSILNEAALNLENMKMFAGLIGVKGEGVQVIINDEQKFLNCYDLMDVVNELKAGGAEAVSVNGIRVKAMTGFKDDIEGHVIVNENKIEPPFVIKAIGDVETLSQAVGLLGGVQYALTSYEGVTFEVLKMDNLEIPAI